MTVGYLLQRDSGARAARNLDFCRLWLILCNLERSRLILGLRVWKGAKNLAGRIKMEYCPKGKTCRADSDENWKDLDDD
jgi:hypothetical protein